MAKTSSWTRSPGKVPKGGRTTHRVDNVSAGPAPATGDDGSTAVHRSAAQGAAGDRGVGRPPGRDAEQVRQKLLAAARELFLSYEFKAVSVRQIASRAGVNGAMVNYYFGGKKGLYLAMVDEVFSTLEHSLRELDAKRSESVTDFIRTYMQFLAGNPWWPNFIVREVLFGQEEIRQPIVARFSSTFVQGLIGAITGEVESGHFRKDLHPELATWSLMGMMVFPFLSHPIARRLLHQELEEAGVTELITHTCELFARGVVNREAG